MAFSFGQMMQFGLTSVTKWVERRCKLWGNLCSPPLHMPHKSQNSTLDSLVKYSHTESLPEALQGLHSLVEIKGKVVPL